jgi:hypothetical protein
MLLKSCAVMDVAEGRLAAGRAVLSDKSISAPRSSIASFNLAFGREMQFRSRPAMTQCRSAAAIRTSPYQETISFRLAIELIPT